MNRAERRRQKKISKKTSLSNAVGSNKALVAQEAMEKGVAFHKAGNLKEASKWYNKVLAIQPQHTMALSNFGLALKDLGQLDAAISCYKKTLSLDPNLAGVHNNLGLAYKEQGKFVLALESYHKAISIDPNFGAVFNNLGLVQNELGELDEANKSYKKAISIQPSFAQAYNNLGLTLKEQLKTDEAEYFLKKAVALKPNFAGAHNNLGLVLKDQGKLTQAIVSFQKALAINPRYEKAHSNFLFTISYYVMFDSEQTLQAHLQWDKHHGQQEVKKTYLHKASGDKNKKLNIGYISSDFKRHPVAAFMHNILQGHNKNQFKIFCYSGVKYPDNITSNFKKIADIWQDTTGLSDTMLADNIYRDKIDILIDLSGHTNNNRLKVFAKKPAPIQATYLGYCNTTGLHAMDYWLTDNVLTPVDSCEKSVETILPLSGCWVCYQPYDTVPVEMSKREPDDGVVFGSFNQISKLTDNVVKLWSSILSQTPNSKLLLKTKYLNNPNSQKTVLNKFLKNGIEAKRIILQGSSKSYMKEYGLIDIALDPFPRTGGATTCDALWMGVPVITLAGKRMIERQGASILTAIGKSNWIAQSDEEYAKKAIELAQQGIRNSDMRVELHNIVANSSLCDPQNFVADLESAYRKMWLSHILDK
ncbi:MAG: tetratricopeptide repeat protein [Magnetococcales bacterium]|nr:tetratricopeptide repeat protein [Magnetococcales bacterium]